MNLIIKWHILRMLANSWQIPLLWAIWKSECWCNCGRRQLRTGWPPWSWHSLGGGHRLAEWGLLTYTLQIHYLSRCVAETWTPGSLWSWWNPTLAIQSLPRGRCQSPVSPSCTPGRVEAGRRQLEPHTATLHHHASCWISQVKCKPY